MWPDPSLAKELVAELRQRGLTLATCESLTGGLLGATITAVPGASAVYRGGLITYATDLKHSLAGVEQAVLDSDGAVAQRTAVQMARGAARRCGADYGVALTGVAGPEQQEGKPAGTVHCGICGAGVIDGGLLDIPAEAVRSGRSAVRIHAVELAISALLGTLRDRDNRSGG